MLLCFPCFFGCWQRIIRFQNQSCDILDIAQKVMALVQLDYFCFRLFSLKVRYEGSPSLKPGLQGNYSSYSSSIVINIALLPF